MLETLTRAGDNAVLPEFGKALVAVLEKNVPGARWLCDYLCAPERAPLLLDLVLAARDERIRKTAVELCVAVCRVLGPAEEAVGTFEAEEKVNGADGSFALVPHVHTSSPFPQASN